MTDPYVELVARLRYCDEHGLFKAVEDGRVASYEESADTIERLGRLVHVPGAWRCVKCNFTLIQSNLNAQDGSVTARDDPGDKCPNDGSPLWRVSYRDWCAENETTATEMIERKSAEITRLRASAEQMAACLEKIVALNQQREWTATEDNPETHWETRDGQYAKIARQALATYREDKS